MLVWVLVILYKNVRLMRSYPKTLLHIIICCSGRSFLSLSPYIQAEGNGFNRPRAATKGF